MGDSGELSFEKCLPSFAPFLLCEGVFARLFLGSCQTPAKDFFLLFPFVSFEVCTYWSMQRFPLQGNILVPLSTCKIWRNLCFHRVFHLNEWGFFFPTSRVSSSSHNPLNVTDLLSCSWLSKQRVKKGLGNEGSLKAPFAAAWCWQRLGSVELCLLACCSEERSQYPGIRGT